MAREELSLELAPLGGAMLRAIVEDFTRIGVEVVAPLDERASLSLGSAQVTRVRAGADFVPIFTAAARGCDAALVVAPEFGGLLEGWARLLSDIGVKSLGCPPEAIAAAGDKLGLASRLAAQGVPTPPTVAGLAPPGDWSFPLIAKPRFGAGCESTFVVTSRAELAALPRRDDWILQPYIAGRPASAAFIAHEHGVLRPLRAGEQHIAGVSRLSYNGGRMPLDPAREARALRLGARAITTLPSPHGYVGVDLVLGDAADGSRDVVIEINPRPTVAYVGLRALCTTSLAAAILDPAAPLDWLRHRLAFDGQGRVEWSYDA